MEVEREKMLPKPAVFWSPDSADTSVRLVPVRLLEFLRALASKESGIMLLKAVRLYSARATVEHRQSGEKEISSATKSSSCLKWQANKGS